MTLNYKTFGSGSPLIILHGLLGSLDNWQTLAKKYAEEHTVFIIDQRNHGKSPHSPDSDYKIMAEDLYEFMTDHHIYESHILGHSMGGKVAMQFALEHDDMVDKLIVADIAPVRYVGGHELIFKSLMDVDLPNAKSRENVEDQLKTNIPDFGTRQFLMKGLTRSEDKAFVWKYNLDALWNHYQDILGTFESDEIFDHPTLFIRGGNSSYVKDEYLSLIEKNFSDFKVETVENAGHWLHAEKPKPFFEQTQKFLLD